MTDLAAVRTRLMSYPRVTPYDDDVQALVAAYDAQITRIAELEAERNLLRENLKRIQAHLQYNVTRKRPS